MKGFSFHLGISFNRYQTPLAHVQVISLIYNCTEDHNFFFVSLSFSNNLRPCFLPASVTYIPETRFPSSPQHFSAIRHVHHLAPPLVSTLTFQHPSLIDRHSLLRLSGIDVRELFFINTYIHLIGTTVHFILFFFIRHSVIIHSNTSSRCWVRKSITWHCRLFHL